jgi:hypothetical protein
MKIKITEKGYYDQAGNAVAVGTVIDLDQNNIPPALAKKCEILGNENAGDTPVTNDDALVAKHRGGGSYSIMRGEEELRGGMSKEDANAFDKMSDEEKASYLASLGE